MKRVSNIIESKAVLIFENKAYLLTEDFVSNDVRTKVHLMTMNLGDSMATMDIVKHEVKIK